MDHSPHKGGGSLESKECASMAHQEIEGLGEDLMSDIERIYTVPLKNAWKAQRYRRAERAMTELKSFAKRHMKAEQIIVDTKVNEALWARGIRSPPRRIRVKMTKDPESVVKIELIEEEVAK